MNGHEQTFRLLAGNPDRCDRYGTLRCLVTELCCLDPMPEHMLSRSEATDPGCASGPSAAVTEAACSYTPSGTTGASHTIRGRGDTT